MTALTDIIALLEGGSATIDKVTITAGELKAGVAALQKFPIADLSNAVTAKLGDVPDDFVVVEDIVTLAGDFGLPDASQAVLAIKALAWVVANNTQGRVDSQTPMHGSGARGSSGSSDGGQIPEEEAGLEDGA